MFNMFGNIFGRMFTPPAAKKEESVFEGAECVNCKAEAGYNPYCDGVRCYDKEDYLPEGYTEDELRSVYYDLNQEAGIDYLVESADFDEVDDYYNPGTEEVDPAFVLEAVTVKKFSRLEGVIRRGMLPVMKEHMKMKDPTTGEPINVLDPIVGKCKKSGGFAYVTAQIPFSDGQVVSIIFHAPEGDGKKIGPSDMVVAFRWLLNKRDITAVVAPEDGKEISLKTIALRLAQLVGKNAKRFAATQKEVQAEKRQLEELQEKQKELDEQAKTYEEQIAGAQEAKTSTAEEIGSLQAQLAKQLATNRELEVKLAGLKKLEEEGRKTQPEPTPEPKAEPEPKTQEYDVDSTMIDLLPFYTINEQGFVEFVSRNFRKNGDKKTWAKVNPDGSITVNYGKGVLSDEYAAELDHFLSLYGKTWQDVTKAGGRLTLRPEEFIHAPMPFIPENVKLDETGCVLFKNGPDKGALPTTAFDYVRAHVDDATGDMIVMLNEYYGGSNKELEKEASDFIDEYISHGYFPLVFAKPGREGIKTITFKTEAWMKEYLQDIIDGKGTGAVDFFMVTDGMKMLKTPPAWEDLYNKAAEVTKKKIAAGLAEPAPEPAPQVTEPEPVPAEPIEPEPAQDDKADKPEWVNDMQDIIDGKYDNDLKKMGKLLNLAIEELDKPGCDPKWEELANKAADRRTVLLKAKAKAAGF